MSRNNEYNKKLTRLFVPSNTLFKSIGADLSRQANMGIPQQINFIEQLEGGNGATTCFIVEKQ